MAKNEQMITQGGRRSRVVNKENTTQEVNNVGSTSNNELRGYRNSNNVVNENDSIQRQQFRNNDLNVQQEQGNVQQSNNSDNSDTLTTRGANLSARSEPNTGFNTDIEEPVTRMEKVSKNIGRIIKLIALGVFTLFVVAVVSEMNSSKKIENAEQKRVEYEKYLDGYITALNEANKDAIDGYFGGESLIGEEFEYFQDGVYMENSLRLIQSILSTVSFEYSLTDSGRANTDISTDLYIKYIDYEELAEYIYSDAKGIYEGTKEVKTGTQLDNRILKNYCLGYLADEIGDRVGNAKISYTVGIEETIENKQIVGRFLSQDLDQKMENILFESESLSLCYRILTDAIKGKIEEGISYSEYMAELDKERLVDGLSDEKNYIKNDHFGVLAKQKAGISKICGDGTPNNMATVGTEVQTVYKATVKKKKKGKTKKVKKYCDVLVNIDEVYTGDSAIVYANSISSSNRGLSSSLTGKLFIIEYTVKNLTNYTFKIDNNMGVVDNLGNQFFSTGKIHGLKDSGTLKKNGSITLQYYILCDNLETKYLVYGIDFKKKRPYVWFNTIQECFQSESGTEE